MNETVLKLTDAELAKRVAAVEEFCKSNKLPYFIGIPVENTKEGTSYFYSYLTPAVSGVELTEDKVTKMLNVANGFNTVPPVPVTEFMF